VCGGERGRVEGRRQGPCDGAHVIVVTITYREWFRCGGECMFKGVYAHVYLLVRPLQIK
jgi:hypothetical protein